MKMLVALLIPVVLIIIYRMTKGWLSPARISAVVWTFFCVGYIVLSDDVFLANGVGYLMLSTFVLSVGEFIGVRIKPGQKRHVFGSGVSDSVWKILLIVILIAIFYDFYIVVKNGFDLSYFYDVDKLMSMNSEMAYQRYFGDDSKTIIESILMTFLYVAAIFGGYLYLYGKNRRQKALCIFSLLPLFLNMLFQNTKLVLLDGLFLWFVGFSISYLLINKKNPNIKSKIIMLILLCITVVGVLFFISMCLRIGSIDSNTMSIVRNKFKIYAFGSVESFSKWSYGYIENGYGLGVNTLLAPFDLMGIVVRQQGVYDFISGIDSNIFTGFRALIADFGYAGSLIVVLLFGVISGFSYKKLLSGAPSKIDVVVYGCCLFTILHFWLGSPWVYSSFWLAFVVFYFLLSFSGCNLRKEITR